KPGGAERIGEFRLQLLNAFRRRGRQIREDFMDIDGSREMPRAVGIRIAGVDDDTRFFLEEFREFAGSNQNVRHGRPLLFYGCWLGRSEIPLVLVAGQHLAKLLGGGGDDGDEIGFAEPALGAMALEVTARAAM